MRTPKSVDVNADTEITSTINANADNPLHSRIDIITEVLAQCPRKDFLYLAGVSNAWRTAWALIGGPKETSIHTTAALPARTEWALSGGTCFWGVARRYGGVFCLTTRMGNLQGLQAAARDFGPDWSSQGSARKVTELAAENGHRELLEWAIGQGCPWGEHTCGSAASAGHLDILAWLRDQGCGWDELTCRLAAQGGHLKLLKWAAQNGCPWDESTSSCAAAGGQLEVMQWLREQSCPWDEHACSSAAAQGGHLDALKWMREKGCSWDSGTHRGAASGGHLEVRMELVNSVPQKYFGRYLVCNVMPE